MVNGLKDELSSAKNEIQSLKHQLQSVESRVDKMKKGNKCRQVGIDKPIASSLPRARDVVEPTC